MTPLHRQSHVDLNHHAAPNSGLTIGQFAHELNSLLDGSMRCVALVQRALNGPAASGTALPSDLSKKLSAAHTSMTRMATLLGRAMAGSPTDVHLFDERQPLGEQVGHILAMLEPMALEFGVRIESEITPKAATLPVATLGPVILNALRNAIEACAADGTNARCVELSIAVRPSGHLLIVVADTGPGAPDDLAAGTLEKPGGHGFGLDLVRRIVEDLGGEVSLTNVPFGPGAVLQVIVPMRNLVHHV